MPEAGGLVDYYIANFAQNVNRHKKLLRTFLAPFFITVTLFITGIPLSSPGQYLPEKKKIRPFFCACGAILFSAVPFPESKISAPAERKNRFFFKASPASGAAQKDKGLKLKSEHRHNAIVIGVLTEVEQTAGIKVGTPRAVV